MPENFVHDRKVVSLPNLQEGKLVIHLIGPPSGFNAGAAKHLCQCAHEPEAQSLLVLPEASKELKAHRNES
jgi:hypothetical protein